eukprot:scaffold982_cov234-Chaetoceros_neogracile.AAC.18
MSDTPTLRQPPITSTEDLAPRTANSDYIQVTRAMSWRYLRTADRLTNTLSNNLFNMKIFKNNKHITLFFAASFVAAMTVVPKIAEGKELVDENELHQDPATKVTTCPHYGCSLLPRDMYFDEDAKRALKAIRVNNTHAPPYDDSEVEVYLDSSQALELLKSAGGEDQATLTLIGYKGGDVKEQINQDRAFVISPYFVKQTDDEDNSMKRLMGVFDGHAKLGELVSEYTVSTLPKVLSAKLEIILAEAGIDTSQTDVQKALIDTFVELDKSAPAEKSGGCTASVVLQLGKFAYVANAGDSRSLIATYNKSTLEVKIVYISREDKPDLPEERSRVESMGGQVYVPSAERIEMGASSRVLYVDPVTGGTNGLAMSRSIGDWAAGEKGVIPDPTVDVVDIDKIINGDKECSASAENNHNSPCQGDIEVFAVSATDGLLDFMNVNDIASTVAQSLYADDGPHPLSACESLITTAASAWWQAKNGQYRDDIAIAVSKLSLK